MADAPSVGAESRAVIGQLNNYFANVPVERVGIYVDDKSGVTICDAGPTGAPGVFTGSNLAACLAYRGRPPPPLAVRTALAEASFPELWPFGNWAALYPVEDKKKRRYKSESLKGSSYSLTITGQTRDEELAQFFDWIDMLTVRIAGLVVQYPKSREALLKAEGFRERFTKYRKFRAMASALQAKQGTQDPVALMRDFYVDEVMKPATRVMGKTGAEGADEDDEDLGAAAAAAAAPAAAEADAAEAAPTAEEGGAPPLNAEPVDPVDYYANRRLKFARKIFAEMKQESGADPTLGHRRAYVCRRFPPDSEIFRLATDPKAPHVPVDLPLNALNQGRVITIPEQLRKIERGDVISITFIPSFYLYHPTQHQASITCRLLQILLFKKGSGNDPEKRRVAEMQAQLRTTGSAALPPELLQAVEEAAAEEEEALHEARTKRQRALPPPPPAEAGPAEPAALSDAALAGAMEAFDQIAAQSEEF